MKSTHVCIISDIYDTYCLIWQGQCLKQAAWVVGDHRFEPHSGLQVSKKKSFFLAHSERFNIVGNLRDQEVGCLTSDRQGSNFEYGVCRAVSSRHPHDVLLAQFSLYVHKGGLKPHSFNFLPFERSVLKTRSLYCFNKSCRCTELCIS